MTDSKASTRTGQSFLPICQICAAGSVVFVLDIGKPESFEKVAAEQRPALSDDTPAGGGWLGASNSPAGLFF
jgi:hypothetical protein